MGIDVYNQQAAISEDPYMLILKLYEGLLRYLSFVKEAIENEKQEIDYERKIGYAEEEDLVNIKTILYLLFDFFDFFLMSLWLAQKSLNQPLTLFLHI